MPTQSAAQALKILRDGSQFQWYVIPLFALVVYVYAVEVERKRWDLVFAGLAFWGMDWFNEIWNGLAFHFTQYAPVWGAPGKTAFLILIGLNIEICFMFAIAGITFSKLLPADKRLESPGAAEPVVLCHRRFRVLRLCGGPAQLGRRTHVGVCMVGCSRAVAHFPDRLLAFLPGVFLGV